MRPCRACDQLQLDNCCQPDHASRQKQSRSVKKSTIAVALLAASLPTSMAQANCVSLRNSSTCPAFSSASIDPSQSGNLYVDLEAMGYCETNMCSPFLQFVRDVTTFDDRLREYISGQYAQRQSVFADTWATTILTVFQVSKYLRLLERQSY